MRANYSISHFRRQFPDENACLDYLFLRISQEGKVCPKCNHTTKFYKVKNRKCYESGCCGHQIYPMQGTIFEKSRTSLLDWFYIIFKFQNSRNGVSAKEIQRELGVTYKTAWRIGHQIRKLMSETSDFMLDGVVEMDESQIGGRKNKNKFYVFGMIERGGRVKTKIVRDRPSGQELIPIIKECVKKGATVYSDKYGAYQTLNSEGYNHKSISHKQSYAYKNGISTNCIEGFWAYFKNSILGTHRKVSRDWLHSYLNEFTFRYNRRNSTESMFLEMLGRVRFHT